MKKNILIVIVVFLVSLSACENFLDTSPKDFLSPVNYYKTADQLNTALVGVYDVIGDPSVYGTDWWYRLGVSTDESFFRNATNIDIRTLKATSGDPTVSNTWRALYRGINRANTLLDAIDHSSADDATIARVRAEAKFLRGYYYFLLVSNWGGVPLRLNGTTTVDDNIKPRSSVKEVYDQILKDMTEAVPDLLTITRLGASGSGRVSKTAAQGILARVCLTMAGAPLYETARYEDAKIWALEVINSGEHALNPDYKQIFINHTKDEYDTKESIWEAEFSYDPSLVYSEFSAVGYLNSIKSDNLDSGFCTALIAPTGLLWKLYVNQLESDGIYYNSDLRRDWNIAPFHYVEDDPAKGRTYLADNQIYQRYAGKWRRTYETGPKQKFYTYTNFPILRYADVLLMYAEAENALNGPTTDAVDKINQVRRRGWGFLLGNRVRNIIVNDGGTGYTQPPTVTISGGGGTGAIAEAVVTNGVVTSIRITSQGNSYTNIPTVVLAGGGGTGASATAILTQITDADLLPAQTSSPEVFQQVIQDERARELCFEGLRTSDLKRWDIYISSLRTTAADFTQNGGSLRYGANAGNNVHTRNLLLPIPVSEITINTAMTQNPGY